MLRQQILRNSGNVTDFRDLQTVTGEMLLHLPKYYINTYQNIIDETIVW